MGSYEMVNLTDEKDEYSARVNGPDSEIDYSVLEKHLNLNLVQRQLTALRL